MGCNNSKGNPYNDDTDTSGAAAGTAMAPPGGAAATGSSPSPNAADGEPEVRRGSVVHKAAEFDEGRGVRGRLGSKSDPSVHLPYDPKKIGVVTRHGIAPAARGSGHTSKAKINQDRGIVCWPFNGTHDQALFCVFDGHGFGGERISEWCTSQITQRLEADRVTLKKDQKGTISKAVIEMDKTLLSHPQLGEPASGAGTTSNVLYFHGNQVWIACSGDSRAVLSRRRGNKVEAFDLSRDHKPDLPAEKKRIEKAGGTVSAAGPRGLPPSRVWVNGRVGLAMSRSIGDGEAKGHGVIPDPEINEVTLNPPVDGKGDGDLCVIVASDGIWEFISSQQACDTVNKHSDNATAASETLVKLAEQRWQEEEGSYRDDITCIVAFLPFLEDRPDETYDGSYEAVQNDAVIIDSTDANSFVVEESIVLDAPEDAGAGVKSGESFAQRRLTLSDQQAEAARKIQEEAALVA